MKTTQILSVLTALLLSTAAQASWVLQPELGYQMGNRTVELVAFPGITASSSETGTIAGLKFGHIFGNRMMAGVEYVMETGGQYKQDSTTSDFTRSDAFLNLGYDAGRWNVYFGYGLMDSMTFPASGGNAEAKLTGTNMKVGFGFNVANHFSVGLEYLMPKYTKAEQGGTTSEISTQYSKFDTSSYNVNLSFPFVF